MNPTAVISVLALGGLAALVISQGNTNPSIKAGDNLHVTYSYDASKMNQAQVLADLGFISQWGIAQDVPNLSTPGTVQVTAQSTINLPAGIPDIVGQFGTLHVTAVSFA